MICPKCHGTGWRVVPYTDGTWSREVEPCDYPGCHGGSVDCCDGLREQPAATSKRKKGDDDDGTAIIGGILGGFLSGLP